MNSHVYRYYRAFRDETSLPTSFHDVVILQESPTLFWEDAVRKAPYLPKGWFELCKLEPQDRVEFICAFWLDTLPYVPHVSAFLEDFFNRIDDVGVFLTQSVFDGPYDCELVYSLKNGSSFFHAAPPCPEEEIDYVRKDFSDILPQDYLAFLRIHDGFAKYVDKGLIPTRYLKESYQKIQKLIQKENLEIFCGEESIDPKRLFPFYDSFGQGGFQCFFLDWNPTGTIGNVYCSYSEGIISDYRHSTSGEEDLAFSTFLDWLTFYLEILEG